MKFTLILILTFLPIVLFSQTKEQRNKIIKSNDLEKLESLRDELQSEFLSKKAKAVEFASINNLPLFYNDSSGNYAELMDVINNHPIYYTTFNLGSAITSRANELKQGGSLGLNLNGQNMIVGVWDANHPRITHNDYASRVAVFDGDSNSSNHSTHVTGTILSSGASSSEATGIAPLGEGWIFNWTNDLAEMATYAQFGLLVSNHSYGLIAENVPLYFFGAYISSSRSIDDITFAAPYYQPVIAAGNDRDNFQDLNPSKNGADLLTQYSTAKNAIVVAAVNGVSNYSNASSVSMSSFSNYGPTDDLRIKPDISTKGVSVVSSTSLSNTSFGTLSGTSMSAPGVSGVIMLMQEYFSSLNGGEFMKSSTVRGLIANSADEAGPFDGPDAMFGWGLLNAEKAALTISGNNQTSILQELTLSQNQTFSRVVNANGLEKLKVTISWTDRPGQINSSQTIDLSTPVLINDLDLRVTKNEQTFLPWKLTNGTTLQASKADNNVDNIEKVEVENAVGQYTITVSHKGNLVGSSQDYSLIVSGVDENLSLTDNDLGIKIYPNPIYDNLNFNFQNGTVVSDLQIEIFDIQGRLVLSKEIADGNNEVSLNVENLYSGVYLVKITNDSKFITKKILKN